MVAGRCRCPREPGKLTANRRGRGPAGVCGTRRDPSNGELLYFAVAMGTLLTIFQNEPDNLNGTYRGVLDYLIGDN